MPEPAFKRLLVRLGLDTKELKPVIQSIRSQLKEVNDQAKKDANELTAIEKKHSVAIKQQIDDQRRLTAEARTMLAIDQAKAQWEKQQQEHINTKIRAKALETAELKKQQVEEQKLLIAERQRVVVEKENLRLKEQEANLFKVGTIKAQ